MADFNALKNPGFYNLDCMEALRAFPDNYFELALVDSPYGDGQSGDGRALRWHVCCVHRRHRNATAPQRRYNRFGGAFDKYKRTDAEQAALQPFRRPPRSLQAAGTNNPGAADKPVERRGGQWAAKYGNHIIAWDVAPSAEYFEQLFRVSQNQVIWGGITFFFRQRGASWCIAKQTYP